MIYSVDFKNAIEKAFLEYGSSVAQERSIPDVRDALKIGLRQGLYSQYHDKLTHKNKFQKAQKSVAAAMSLCYVHGDAAMYDAFIRSAKPWAYRYPLEEAQGSYGSPCSPDDHSAARYVEMRSGELADYFFEGLKKNAVAEWYDNYDDTEKIPSVLPSIGFWNIVNGCSGIAVAMATSVPQFNLREVNNALIKLIENPSCDFSEIYCAPDFATGGTITNAAEVRKSLENGKGSSIRLRANLEYDAKQNMIRATELPYSVYTNTIMEQLEKLTNEDENYGIDRVVDHTKEHADIRIYLSKTANPSVMIKKLYKDTSLENWFSINMIMLDHGRFPKVFGWREACQAYIEHIRECKTREIQYDLDMLIYRNHILEGLLVAIANIDDVIALIKNSESSVDAKNNLMKKYHLDEDQAKAILDIKLQRLAKLEAIKINNELEKNISEITSLRYILNTPEELNRLLIDALNEVSKKFGDARRTKVLNIIDSEEEEEEEVPVMLRIVDNTISFTKKKLSGQIIETTNLDTLIGFSADGKMYKVKVKEIPEGKGIKFASLFKVSNIIKVYSLGEINQKPFLYFSTKLGYIKKSNVSDYNYSGRSGTKTLKLRPDDIVTDILLTDETKGIWYKTLNGHSSSARKIVKALKSTGISAYGTLMEKENKIMGLMEKENDD